MYRDEAELLRWQRSIDGLSLADFHIVTRIDPGLCSKYENGKLQPSDRHYRIIIDYLAGCYEKKIKAHKLLK